MFRSFSRIVSEARSAYVVLDTAPTGHSLLLMDATGAYHRQMLRETSNKTNAHLVTPLLAARLAGVQKQMERIVKSLSRPSYVVPWLAEPPVGLEALGERTR